MIASGAVDYIGCLVASASLMHRSDVAIDEHVVPFQSEKGGFVRNSGRYGRVLMPRIQVSPAVPASIPQVQGAVSLATLTTNLPLTRSSRHSPWRLIILDSLACHSRLLT